VTEFEPMENLGNPVKEHLILGTDKRDAETQRDLWLLQNPAVRIVRIHHVKPEPRTLLTRIGARHVPHVSITVEYEEPDVRAESRSRPAPASEENHCEKYRDGSGHQRPITNLLVRETELK
jgi:hypothetical protein